MSFLNYVSYLSVHRFIRPRYIFVHGDAPPHGYWWKQTIDDVTNIYYVNASEAATHIYGKRIKSPEHRSDILRYKIIYGKLRLLYFKVIVFPFVHTHYKIR